MSKVRKKLSRKRCSITLKIKIQLFSNLNIIFHCYNYYSYTSFQAHLTTIIIGKKKKRKLRLKSIGKSIIGRKKLLNEIVMMNRDHFTHRPFPHTRIGRLWRSRLSRSNDIKTTLVTCLRAYKGA